ncbi:MAG: glycoside hydrolase family 43 protein [Spirochaetes bacterium]|jgi:xylan 1,4-beta-xylosidase|nr:glycoside hydrolase family 43 protein [Spirochaetota bacterium]
MIKVKNPILRGFNPDPSIVRVGDDYYIATSTFEWYPGVQIHHSRDLVNWNLVARPLCRDTQLNMMGSGYSMGVWAPCLTYSDGLFYLCYTNVKEPGTMHNYLVTSESIEGDWSDPVYLDSRGFDPSLFHDDDGRKWYVVMYLDMIAWNYLINLNFGIRDDEASRSFLAQYEKNNKDFPFFKGILLQEYDDKQNKLIGPVHRIFDKVLGVTEGPHLYKRNEYYYLVVAEGGTSYEHAITMARSRNIEGPYEVHPDNPVLTASGTDALIQKAGHGDVVECANGDVYLVHLGSRPIGKKKRCILGRETSLQKAKWDDDGWLRLATGDNTPQAEFEVADLPKTDKIVYPQRDDFDSETLNINFQWLRGDIFDAIASLTERPGFLRLKGKEAVYSKYVQALVARRQQSFVCSAETAMEFSPDEENQMAGLVVYYCNELFYYLYVGFDYSFGPYLSVMSKNLGGAELFTCERIQIFDERICLKAEINHEELRFFYSSDEGLSWKQVGDILDMSLLSDDVAGGFTGAFVGMACHDPATMCCHADFDCFVYSELE